MTQAEGYLFLDDTVAIESVWVVRDDVGHLTIRRVYGFGFEYSDTGNNRREGRVTMIGSRVIALHFAPRPVSEARTWS